MLAQMPRRPVRTGDDATTDRDSLAAAAKCGADAWHRAISNEPDTAIGIVGIAAPIVVLPPMRRAEGSFRRHDKSRAAPCRIGTLAAKRSGNEPAKFAASTDQFQHHENGHEENHHGHAVDLQRTPTTTYSRGVQSSRRTR